MSHHPPCMQKEGSTYLVHYFTNNRSLPLYLSLSFPCMTTVGFAGCQVGESDVSEGAAEGGSETVRQTD